MSEVMNVWGDKCWGDECRTIGNDTNEYDNDTNGRNDENSKEDSENIADNVHQNNGEQGHLQFSSKRVKVINDCDEESESFNLMEDGI